MTDLELIRDGLAGVMILEDLDAPQAIAIATVLAPRFLAAIQAVAEEWKETVWSNLKPEYRQRILEAAMKAFTG